MTLLRTDPAPAGVGSPVACGPVSDPVRAARPPAMGLRRWLVRAARRWLATQGVAVVGIERGWPDDLETYVRRALRRGLEVERVAVLDADPEPVRILFGLFDPARVVCCSETNWTALDSRFGRSEPLMIEIDAREIRLESGAERLAPLLARASAVIVRVKPADFSAGEGDVLDLTGWMRRAGFELYDVLQRPSGDLIRASAENLYLAFERAGAGGDEPGRGERAARKAEALHFFSAPIAKGRQTGRVGGRGAYGMMGGISNPGVIVTEKGVILLARGEWAPWAVQRLSWSSFAASSQPVALSLGGDLEIARTALVRFSDSASPSPARAEDFRLFEHDGGFYANHSLIFPGPQPLHPVVPEGLRTSLGLSRFDPDAACLTYLGLPVLDRPVGPVEKNWAMFSAGGSVRLIYSFQPYRLLSAERLLNLQFRATIDHALNLPVPEDGLTFRNSINPVPYDARHLLHLVHKVYPTKQYVFWAVLIDRTTLLPTHMTARPLLRGGANAGASIVYACSAIVRDGAVTVFGGIDDCSIGRWRIPQADLDRHWISLS